MAIEAGAKNGIFPVDDVTRAYVAGRVNRPWTAVEADPDAEYTRTIELNLDEIDCTVAWPHLPENAHSARDGADIAIDQVVIGSCTNGQIDDMAAAAADPEGSPRRPRRARASSSPRRRASTASACTAGLYGHLPRRGLHRLHADLRAVSGRPHGHSRRAASAASPPPTATSWAAWATSPARSISPRPPWPRHPASRATSAILRRL